MAARNRAPLDTEKEEQEQEQEKVMYVPKQSRQLKQLNDQNFVVLRKGMVLIKSALSAEQQQQYIDMCIHYGEGREPGVNSFYDGVLTTKDGYYDSVYIPPEEEQTSTSGTSSSASPTKSKGKELNLRTKARINVPIEKHEEKYVVMAKEIVREANLKCPSIPCLHDPNVCRINYYTNKGKGNPQSALPTALLVQ